MLDAIDLVGFLPENHVAVSTLILTLLACAIPTAIYVGIIYWVDRYEKEPFWLLSAVFLWGAIPSVILAIFANRYFSITFGPYIVSNLNGLTSAAVVAPIVEETVKGLALIGVLFMRRDDIDGILDGIIYGAMVGMGFAMVENYFYFSAEFARGGLQAFSVNVFFRAIVFGLNHALFSSLFGIGIAISRLSHNELVRVIAPMFGWAFGVTLHALHNATIGLASQMFLIAFVSNYSGLALTILIIVWALRREQNWLEDYLKEEVALGIITFRQYELANDALERRSYLWNQFSHLHFLQFGRTYKFLSLLSKLAYQKHHEVNHPAREHHELIESLRREIRERGEII